MESNYGTSASPTAPARNFSRATIIFTGAGIRNIRNCFRNDVKYVIGQSDFRKDWFFEQVPYNEDTNNTTGGGRGSATTWTMTFDLPDAPHGKATLRLAICGAGTRSIAADMNGQSIGGIERTWPITPPSTATASAATGGNTTSCSTRR